MRLIQTFAALTLLGLFACSSPTQPSDATPTLTATVHAQEPNTPFRFNDGAGMYSEGQWLFIRGGSGGQHYGPVGIAGKVHLTTTPGSGIRRLCVDGNNAVVPCPEADEIAVLRAQIQELRAMVQGR